MVILYILLVAYILAINFYAFLLVKTLRDKERDAAAQAELRRQAAPLIEGAEISAQDCEKTASAVDSESRAGFAPRSPQTPKKGDTFSSESVAPEKCTGKLCITGLLGGAITIYVCMFIFKFKRSDLLLMVLMPLLGVLNVYLWVLLFRSGFSFFVVS